jgi:putative ABC transport system ATP-binding protein
MNVLALHKVSKTYGSGHTAVHAVDQVSLKVTAGQVVLMMGPSGSGKTTLLSIMGTLLRPTSGTVTINDRIISGLSEQQLAHFRLREIGFIFQGFNLLSALTAEQNVMVPLLAAGRSNTEASQKARVLLAKLGLKERLGSLPKNLSGGERQRVAIARALANNPQLILADEPTANLDAARGHEVAQLLRRIAKDEGKAIIVASHDPRLKSLADRVITIEDGRLVQRKS